MNKAILFLDKLALDIYAEKMTAIPRLTFPPGVLADLEIIDVARLDQVIKAFIDANKLTPLALNIVISPNLTFTKDILDPKAKKNTPDPKNPAPAPTSPADADKDGPTLEELKQNFLETVPFDEVSHITLPIQGGSKVIAANKTMYMLIKRAFEKYGFSVEGVTSLVVFGNTVLPVDQTIARKLFAKLELVKQHNMLVVAPPPQAKKEGFVITKPSETKDGNKRAFIMLGVLGLLFILMGYMLYQMLNDPTMKKKPKKERPVTAVSQTPTPVVADAPASASAALTFSNLTFQIVSPTRNSSEAASLRTALEDAEAKDVTLVVKATTTSRPTIAYSAELSKEEIANLTTFAKEHVEEGIVREGEDLATDVVVTLPKE